MDVVLRPAQDEFLREVVFAAFQAGADQVDATLSFLHERLGDEATKAQLELVADRAPPGVRVSALEVAGWGDIVSKLLFWSWRRQSWGWTLGDPYPAFAASWEQVLGLAFLLEDPKYPYADDADAYVYRREFWARPRTQLLLASMLCGLWDPMPSFAPAVVLTERGGGVYDPAHKRARADWSWRPALPVSQWFSRSPAAFRALLAREKDRLQQPLLFEFDQVLDHWLGRVDEAPPLSIAFSGLGPGSEDWVRAIGGIAKAVRTAANGGLGLTAVFARPRERPQAA